MIRRLALPLVLVVLIAVPAAGASGSRTLQLVSVQQSFASDRQAPTVGARLFFGDAIYNATPQFGKPAGARVGHAEGVCTIVTARQAQCTITAHVPDGQIVVGGGMLLREGLAHNHFAILGGAGAYGAARGTVDSRDVSQTKSLITLRFGA